MDLLRNAVQRYAWGSPTMLPRFLRVAADGTPQAEMWMGAHPSAPSHVRRNGVDRNLAQVIADDPVAELGAGVAAHFAGRLPFLVKLLAAGEPLSLQAHPTRAQARAGFDRENAAGLPLDSPQRLYRDANHKPEILCALSDFEGLCGFRPVAATVDLLSAIGGRTCVSLAERLTGEGLQAVVTALLHSNAVIRAETVAGVLAACADAPQSPEVGWVLRLAERYPGDIGVVVALLLNLVRLAPGQALYLGPGNLHAYLGGLGVEVMANSDNVLRGGLTPKHVDVDELLAVLDFTPMADPVFLAAEVSPGVEVFDTPAPDFRLWVHTLGAGARVEVVSDGAQILVCTSGEVLLEGVALVRGASAYVRAGEHAAMETTSRGGATVHRCTVGDTDAMV